MKRHWDKGTQNLLVDLVRPTPLLRHLDMTVFETENTQRRWCSENLKISGNWYEFNFQNISFEVLLLHGKFQRNDGIQQKHLRSPLLFSLRKVGPETWATGCFKINVKKTGSEACPASYPVGTGGSFPGGKAAGMWRWLLTSIHVKDDWNYTSTPPIRLHGVVLS
jgi:hypothetical protein